MKISKKEQVIFENFQRYGKNAKQWMNKCVLLLPKIEKRRIWEKKGFGSIYEFAAKLAGMSRNKVNEGLRILEKTKDLPEIRKIIEKKGIWAVKPVLRVVTPENQEFWVQKAKIMKKSTLETYVKDILEDERRRTVVGKARCEDLRETVSEARRENLWETVGEAKREDLREIVSEVRRENLRENVDENKREDLWENVDEANREVRCSGSGYDNGRPGAAKNDGKPLFKPNSFQKIEIKVKAETAKRLFKIKDKEDWETLMQEFLEYKEEKEKQFQQELKDQKPKKVQTASSHVPTAIQNYVKLRAKSKCEEPNCTNPGKHLHHTTPFALKKEHDPDKIRFLCEEHHSIAHYGLIQNEEQSPQKWWPLKFPDPLDIKGVINNRVAEFRRAPG